jgi:sugar lactone lactonase YvrE
MIRFIAHPGLFAVVSALLVAGCNCSRPPVVLPPTDGGSPTVCDNDALAAGCAFGRCYLSTASRPLPAGGQATVIEEPVPSALVPDVLSSVLCRVVLPDGVVTTDLTLGISLDSPPSTQATLFAYDDVSQSGEALPSHLLMNRVTGLVTTTGAFGVTEVPGQWSVNGYLGTPKIDTTTPTDLLRNLSSNSFSSAFYDGQRLYVGNGPRLLIYDGLPKGPASRPAVVLGQPDLINAEATTSGSLFGTALVSSIWSDGTRLLAATGSRVLIWLKIPTADLTPADIVLGQPDFSTNLANIGGISGATMSSVGSITSDGVNLFAADTQNHRVLVWFTIPHAVGQAADAVIGQPDFISNLAYGGAFPLYLPVGVAETPTGVFIAGLGGPAAAHTPTITTTNPPSDFSVFGWQFDGTMPATQVNRPAAIITTPQGGLAVRDIALRRIAVTRQSSSGPAHADFMLGQPDSTRVVGVNWIGGNSSVNPSRVSASTFADDREIGHGNGALLIPDGRRLLIYDSFPTYNFEPATRVLGQAGPSINESADYRGISAATLANPADVAFNGSTLAVADRGNNRVLLFDASVLSAQAPSAFAVVGQADDHSYVANTDQLSPSAGTLSGPTGVALDGTHLIVADTENHRVLIWKTVPHATGVAADLVLGQADFSGRRPNRGRGDTAPVDGFSDVDADGLFYPSGVASDGTHLFVADRLNHRVLIWDTFPTQNGAPATRVLGQPTMTTVGANGGAGVFTISPTGLNLPTGLALSGKSLWVADTENNRVVRYDSVFTTPAVGAVIGQPAGDTVTNSNIVAAGSAFSGNALTPTTSDASVLRPRGVVLAAGRVFVSETDSNRVHVFDATSLMSVAVLGQPSSTAASPNSMGISSQSVSEAMGVAADSTTLWVADSRNHRVLGFDLSNMASGAPATKLLGQPAFVSVGFNRSSTAAEGATASPRGLWLQDTTLYVADTNNHRVLALPAGGGLPLKVYGQPDDRLALPNAGGTATGRTLNAPRGVWADATRLVVADTANNRVLVFPTAAGAQDATLVLGQTSLSASTPNSGGASLATLNEPGQVCSDGTGLYVVDTGNHRVLGWKTFPSVSGQTADVVLGQADGQSILGNRGADPTASSLSLPAGCALVGGHLFVADTGNNRVLRFDMPKGNGQPADGVLGQDDFTSRIPSSMLGDTSRLAGPVGLASDATNLYVVDRDLARVVVYGPGFDQPGAKAQATLSAIGGPNPQQVLAGIAASRAPYFGTTLYVSDTGANRIADISGLTRLRP